MGNVVKMFFHPVETMNISFSDLAEDIAQAREVAVITGAGMSQESGIPTFRGDDGFWSKYNVLIYGTSFGFSRSPHMLWELIRKLLEERKIEPNAGHHAVTALQRMGKVHTIITQNVDNLHQEAGSINVIEIHGSFRTASCVRCGHQIQVKEILLGPDRIEKLPPKCSCGGIYKPDVVLFGDGIPPDAASKANKAVEQADLVLVIGTSCSVSPAGGLPKTAKKNGAKVIEINPECTLLTDRIADKRVCGKATGLKQTVDALQRLQTGNMEN